MKFFLSIVFCIISTNILAQHFTGNWVGCNTDTSLFMQLDISPDSTGYKVSGKIATAGFAVLKAYKTSVKNDSLQITFSQPLAMLTMAYNVGGTSLSGYWSQNGQQILIHAKPMVRPQTPRPPFAYQSDSVEYYNADRSVFLGATFTKPFATSANKTEKLPVAVLITGSGLEDRDETILGHKSFAVIADYLTKQGIAVLRVDDRTMGKSKGDLKNSTSALFAQDVLTSIGYLKTRNDIDTTKIGLIGHSEGGLIAYLVYNQWPHVKFIVTLGGQGVAGSIIMARQGLDAFKAMNSDEKLVAADSALLTETYNLVSKYKNDDSALLHAADNYFMQWKKEQSDAVLEKMGVKQLNGTFYATTLTPVLKNSWMHYFLTIDPVPIIEKIKCPFLILNGAKDKQVYADVNVPAIQKALQKAGNKNVATHVFKNMNHLFQHCNTGAVTEYGMIEESIAPEVLKIVADWIKSTGL